MWHFLGVVLFAGLALGLLLAIALFCTFLVVEVGTYVKEKTGSRHAGLVATYGLAALIILVVYSFRP